MEGTNELIGFGGTPSMGPLHVDLNADEDIVTNFLPFMNPHSPEKGWLTNQNHGELDSFLK